MINEIMSQGSSAFTVAAIVVGVVLIVIIGFLNMWRKVPQDKAAVVTGMRKRVISGGGGLVIPLFERMDQISLENMQIQVNVSGLTSSSVPVDVGSITVLKIKNDKESILAAMEQFNVGNIVKTVDNIKQTAREVLEGKLREIMSSLTVEDLYQDRDKFAASVQDVAALDLAGMGLEIKTFAIKEISDSQGYIEALGKARIAEVKRNADIAEAKALSERDVAVAEAKKISEIEVANRKQETAEAKATADIKIADAERQKEIRLQDNREQTESKKARADQAYKIESNKTQQQVVESELAIQVAEETKRIEVVEASAAVRKKQEEQETEIARQIALRKAEELQAEVQKVAEAQASKIKTEAEADLFKRQKDADALKYEEIAQSEAEAVKKERQAKADADVITKNAEADAMAELKKAEAKANAIKATGMAQAEAEAAVGEAKAKAIRAQGLAEAEIVKQKALAEAEGKKELAQAYKEYGEAAMTQMFVNVLPEIASSVSGAVSSAIAQIDKITILDNAASGGGGTSKLTNLATNLLTEVPEAVKAITGIDMNAMLKRLADGVMEQKEL